MADDIGENAVGSVPIFRVKALVNVLNQRAFKVAVENGQEFYSEGICVIFNLRASFDLEIKYLIVLL